MKKIVLTGGGTAGHVTPNLAIVPGLKAAGWEVEYIGSERGIERQLVLEAGIPYHGISSGKLRRYFDIQNFTDPLKVIKGIFEAHFLLRQLKPKVVFSKGGFVTVPVIFASWLNRIPAIVHESDFTPGLANKLSIPFAAQICVSFPETLKYVPKGIHTGLPIRQEILQGNPETGRKLCNFSQELPVLLVIGGSSGSEKINRSIRAILDKLTARFQVVHACGKGNVNPDFEHYKNYRQFDYLGVELADILAMTDVVVSRAGANSVFELLALKKPNLLIPLSKSASRGDQILNARSFQKAGYSAVLLEEELTEESLWQAICQLGDRSQEYLQNMTDTAAIDSIDRVVQIIERVANSIAGRSIL